MSLNSANYSIHCKSDLWTIERAILLLINVESLPSSDYFSNGKCDSEAEQEIRNKFDDIWDIAKNSLLTGNLKPFGKSRIITSATQVYPVDFIKWAKEKDFKIPSELESLSHELAYKVAFEHGVTKTQLHRISNRPKNEHNWFALKSWSPEQAVCLFYDVNPFEYEQIKNHEDIQRILLDAKEYQSQSPQEWKEFAIKNQIPIPTAFNRIPIVESASNEVNQETTSNNDEKNKKEHQSESSLPTDLNSISIAESTSIENDTNPPSQTKHIELTGWKSPSRQDTWYEVIESAVKSYLGEYEQMPTKAQVWQRLCETPPHGYSVKTGKDKGEPCLCMTTEKPLSRSAFYKRWEKYTSQ